MENFIDFPDSKVSQNNSFESDDDFNYNMSKNNPDRNASFQNIFNTFSNLNFNVENNKSFLENENKISSTYGCNDISMDYEESPIIECINGEYLIKQVKNDQRTLRKRLSSKDYQRSIVEKVDVNPVSNNPKRIKMIFFILSLVLIPLVPVFINTALISKGISWKEIHNTVQELKDKITQLHKPHSFNFLAFKHEINSKLFGQHLSKKILIEKLGSFFGYSCSNENNDLNCVINKTNDLYHKRVLSLLLFGQHGTGKSFVAQMMMNNAGDENIHKTINTVGEDQLPDNEVPAVDHKKLSSNNQNSAHLTSNNNYETFKMDSYHLVMGFDFTSSQHKPQLFKEWLLHNIHKGLSDLNTSDTGHKLLLFVFDDFEEASEDIKADLNAIMQELNSYEKYDDGLKILFILTTKTASEQLKRALYKSIIGMKKNEDFITRNSVVIDEILDQEDLLKTISDSWINSFWKRHSNKPSIDYIIPFLPMEREHVKLCIKYALEQESYESNDETRSILVDKVADALLNLDTPTSTNGVDADEVAISLSGCKKVKSQIALNLRD